MHKSILGPRLCTYVRTYVQYGTYVQYLVQSYVDTVSINVPTLARQQVRTLALVLLLPLPTKHSITAAGGRR